MQTTKILPLLLICWFLFLTTAAQAQWWLQEDKLLALDGADSDEFGHSVSIDGDYAIVGVYKDDDNASDAGAAYIFKRDGITWTQQAKLIASDGEENDWFGQSVSISGDYAVIGADLDDDEGINSGAAYIFKRSGESWTQKAKLSVFDNDGLDRFGWSVSIDGDYVIVGAYNASDIIGSCGAAYIFKRDAGLETWTLENKILASDPASYDVFGYSVSISEDYAVVGAGNHFVGGFSCGAAYIFKRHPGLGIWIEQDKLTASDAAEHDHFGYAVSIDQDHVVVGAKGDDDDGYYSGSAYIFKRDPGLETWSQKEKLTASDGDVDYRFGCSVSIAGDYAVVGAYKNDSKGMESGAAYIFKRDEGLETWSQQSKLTASDGTDWDFFGYSVAICSGDVIAGAPQDADRGSESGSAYIFHRLDGILTLQTPDGGEELYVGCDYNVTWQTQGVVENVTVEYSDNNGSDWEAVETVPNINSYLWQVPQVYSQQCLLRISDSAYPAMNDISDSNFVIDQMIGDLSGDCRIDWVDLGILAENWLTNDSLWSRYDKLTASDGDDGDYFGYSVSIDGDYAVIGAIYDRIVLPASGSAYIFKHEGDSWTEKSKLTAPDACDEGSEHFGNSVSISGDYAIVGAHFEGEDPLLQSGAAYIFKRDDGLESWSLQTRLLACEPAVWDEFGYSVSIDGDYAVVGARESSIGGPGTAYIFKRTGGDWLQTAEITASDGAAGDCFGSCVSISSDYVVIGAPGDDDNGTASGSAYVFKRDTPLETWSQQAKITASDGGEWDLFGDVVSIDDTDCIFAAAPMDDQVQNDSGAVYVFIRDGINWLAKDKLTVSDVDSYDKFGYSVAIDGDYAVIGTQRAKSAYVFYRLADSSWIEVTKLLGPVPAASDQFGWAVSISGDFAIIGAHGDDDNGRAAGAAYTFEKSVIHPAIDMTGDSFVNFRDLAVMANLWLTGVE